MAVPAQKSSQNKPSLVAHRCGGGEFPENTVEAIEKCLALKSVNILQLDVMLTKDERVILFHDTPLENNFEKLLDSEQISPQSRNIALLKYEELPFFKSELPPNAFCPDGSEAVSVVGEKRKPDLFEFACEVFQRHAKSGGEVRFMVEFWSALGPDPKEKDADPYGQKTYFQNLVTKTHSLLKKNGLVKNVFAWGNPENEEVQYICLDTDREIRVITTLGQAFGVYSDWNFCQKFSLAPEWLFGGGSKQHLDKLNLGSAERRFMEKLQKRGIIPDSSIESSDDVNSGKSSVQASPSFLFNVPAGISAQSWKRALSKVLTRGKSSGAKPNVVASFLLECVIGWWLWYSDTPELYTFLQKTLNIDTVAFLSNSKEEIAHVLDKYPMLRAVQTDFPTKFESAFE